MTKAELTQEERLLIKQLAQAMSELLTPPTNLEELEYKIHAQHYFFVDDISKNVHSFLNICVHFGINPNRLRLELIQTQLGIKTETDLDKYIGNEVISERQNEIEIKTMNQLIAEEVHKLEDFLRRFTYGRLKKIKEGSQGKRKPKKRNPQEPG